MRSSNDRDRDRDQDRDRYDRRDDRGGYGRDRYGDRVGDRGGYDRRDDRYDRRDGYDRRDDRYDRDRRDRRSPGERMRVLIFSTFQSFLQPDDKHCAKSEPSPEFSRRRGLDLTSF